MKRTPNEDDYARAIEYELSLDALRLRRKERLGLKKTTLSDHAGMRRIHFIFDRACRKFRAETKWWLQWIDYSLRTNAAKASSRIFARALQLHPLCEDLWLQAATFEYDRQNNVAAARAIMLRSIRANPNSLKLWLAYFRMECLYVLRMKSRRIMLGLDVGDQSAQSSDKYENAEQNKDIEAKEGSEYDVDLPNLDKDLDAETQDPIKQIGLELGKGLQSLSSDDPSLSQFASTLVKDIQSSIAETLKNEQTDPSEKSNAKVSSLASVPTNVSPLAAFFQGSVPRIIYSQAIHQLMQESNSTGQAQVEVVPRSLQRAYFHIAFLKAATDFVDHTAPVSTDDLMYGLHFSPEIRTSCAPFAFPSLVQHIMDSMVEDCPQEPIVWETLAMMPFVPIVKGIETRKKIRDVIDASKTSGHLASLTNAISSSSGPIQAVENVADDDLFMIDTGGDSLNLQEEGEKKDQAGKTDKIENEATSAPGKKLSRKQRKRKLLEVSTEASTDMSLTGVSPLSNSLTLLPTELIQKLTTYSDYCHMLSAGILDKFVLHGSIFEIRNTVQKAFAAAGYPTNRMQKDPTTNVLDDSIALFSSCMFNINGDITKSTSTSTFLVPSVLQAHFLENALVPLNPLSLPLWSVPLSANAIKQNSEQCSKFEVPLSTPNAADPLPMKGDDVSLVKLSEKGAASTLAVLTVAFDTAMLSWSKEVSKWKKRFKLRSSTKDIASGDLMSEVLTLLEENASTFLRQSQSKLASFPLPFTPFAIGVCSVKCLLYIASMPIVQSTHNTRRIMNLYKLAHEKIVQLKNRFFGVFRACAFIPSISLAEKAQVLYFANLASTLHAIHMQILLRMGSPLTALDEAKEAIFTPLAAVSPTPWILYARLHALLRHWYNTAAAVHHGNSNIPQKSMSTTTHEETKTRKRNRSLSDSQNNNKKKIDAQVLLTSSRSLFVAPLKKFSKVESAYLDEGELFPVSLTAISSDGSSDLPSIPHLQKWKDHLEAQLSISVTLQLGIRALDTASYPIPTDDLTKTTIHSFKLSPSFSALRDATFPNPMHQATLWAMLLHCALNPQVEETFNPISSHVASNPSKIVEKAGSVLEAALAKGLGTEVDSDLREMFLSYAITTDNISTNVLKYALQPNAGEKVHYNTLKGLVDKLLDMQASADALSESNIQFHAKFVQSLRNFFEVSLSIHGDVSVELWHLALQFEKAIAENHAIIQLLEKRQRVSKVADLHSKALRSLAPELVPVFQEMMAVGNAQ